MIRLGLRLVISGGREAVVRLLILAAAVGLGVGLLLAAVSAVNAVGAQNNRYAWLDTGPASLLRAGHGGAAAPLWGLVTTDEFNGQARAPSPCSAVSRRTGRSTARACR